ncbi:MULTISPECIES: RecQ family ATP-dependent DNA helicase [Vibrio]|uniref:RecQ family ATP-dependent DNA helicase n=1 Tax=Vibrio TaxID=662 RepID=UPI002076474A|nr:MULTISPECIES: RecQ family ATP-dependent DNA helicase [Vibrio]USD31942.1 RecQ family ATP-dependent DNA helicase [Vibrio sp. SCSIO 43186]USD44986.1 RecQ family ATP-dependent DNA helicase [Vibrio sp. SCSIO 43145]USD69065.1 RecQ family ATP-dependent DNA helicase [Vibrio sp. SCSIO 43139]USD96753.1 recombinase RecQ [Vibrio coralliilyticus]
MQTSGNQEIIDSTLRSTFGFEQLRDGQYTVIDKVLSGRSCAAIFPTGSGKSLCYQLSALCLPHLTLVISPLLALMKDQLEFLHNKGISAASLNSNQSREETQSIMTKVRNGEIKILMVSVERLKNERFRHFLSQLSISQLVVDEAHCISEWGHNFRPDYLKLPQFQQELSIPQVLLLTATATQTVLDDMSKKFNIAPEDITVTGFYRPNLDISVIPCSEEEKDQTLLSIFCEAQSLPTIVYVTQQNSAERIANLLAEKGIKAMAYHAGLDSNSRERIQQDFMAGHTECIAATIAFGMGVDKSDIRRVIHFDLPKSIENYAQEIGRAGRDGKSSQCILLANEDGVSTLENFVYGDTPEHTEIHNVIQQTISSTPNWEVVISRLSSESNIRQLPLKTLLVYMEMANIITAQYSYFADYRFKFIMTKQDIIARFEGERRQFTEALFNCSIQARTWCQVDFEALWQSYNGERARAVAALDYFHQNGWIELESKLMTEVYRVNSLEQSLEQISEQLFNLFKAKETSDVERIHNLLSLFKSESCLSHALASYFSDNQAPHKCGHCSVCRKEHQEWPASIRPKIKSQDITNWLKPLQQKSSSTLSDNLKAKFLCGIATPWFTKIKARNMEGFGQLSSHPYQQVMDAISSYNK